MFIVSISVITRIWFVSIHLEQSICKKIDLEKMNLEFKLEKFSENEFPNYFQLVSNEKVMEMITERPIQFDESKNDFEKLIRL